MIKFKDLQNKVYSDKVCVRFEYEIHFEHNGVKSKVCAYFKRKENNLNYWIMQVLFDRTRDKDSEVYHIDYIMPKSNLPLELVAATGLRYFQLYLKEEVQIKSNMDFELGNTLQGM